MSPQAKHDARTGFHDIKPIPKFKTSDSTLEYIGLSLLLLVFCLLTYKLAKKIKSRKTKKTKLSAIETSTNELSIIKTQLGQNLISLKSASEETSKSLKKYLEAKLRFKATDLTCNEISNELPRVLAQNLGHLSNNQVENLKEKVLEILLETEKISFSKLSATEELELQPRLKGIIGTCLSSTKELENLITTEEKTSVISQSKLAKK